MSRARARWCVAAAVGLGCLLSIISIFSTSLTDDEPFNYGYGRRIAFEGRFDRPTRMDASKLPVLGLAALPERVASWLGLETPLPDRVLSVMALSPREHEYIREYAGVYAGRLVTLIFYIGACVVVFCWGREVYGDAAAVGATAMLAFLPTMLAHSAVATTDAAATCTIVAAAYAITRCLLDPTLERVGLAGLACGAALLTKYSALALVGLGPFFVGLRVVTAERHESHWRVGQGAAASLFLIGVVAALVVCAGFGFQHPITRLAELSCQSRVLQNLTAWIGAVPLLLPREYLTGLDGVLYIDQDHTGGGGVYLLGTLSQRGFASYYLVATLLKTPLPFLILLVMRPWRAHRRYTDLMWLAVVLWFGVQMSFALYSQVGLRYLLPAFPFLALLAGAAWDHGRSPVGRHVATVLVLLLVGESVWTCPRYLSYFNQLIGARRNAYAYLADSNLDWDQARFDLWRWEGERGDRNYVVDPRYEPRSGTVVVRASEFVGVFDPQTYRWLRMAHERGAARLVSTIGDALLVFDVDSTVAGEGGPPGEYGRQ